MRRRIRRYFLVAWFLTGAFTAAVGGLWWLGNRGGSGEYSLGLGRKMLLVATNEACLVEGPRPYPGIVGGTAYDWSSPGIKYAPVLGTFVPICLCMGFCLLLSILWRTPPSAPRPGLCPRCGYDLRATPDRCPECGTATGAA